MAHLYPDTRSLLQIFATRVLQEGQLPEHVAVIMDGNRRYAKSHGMNTKLGHLAGGEKAKEITRWGYEILNREVTLYMFSIENFKRSTEEVEGLMGLLYDYCKQMIKGLEDAKRYDVCIQFIGNWNLIPTKLKPLVARIMLETRHCKAYKINVAFAYTGRNGLKRSMQSIEKGIREGLILPEDVSEYLVEEAQNLVPMKPVDILLRTGGDKRISDFMMWESTEAYIHFVDTTWPELTFWELWDAVLKYQMFRRNIPKRTPSRDALSIGQKERVDAFLSHIREKQWQVLAKFAGKSEQGADGNTYDEYYEETLFRSAVKQLLAF